MTSESSVTRRSFVAGVTGAATFGLSACNGGETKKKIRLKARKKLALKNLLCLRQHLL